MSKNCLFAFVLFLVASSPGAFAQISLDGRNRTPGSDGYVYITDTQTSGLAEVLGNTGFRSGAS